MRRHNDCISSLSSLSIDHQQQLSPSPLNIHFKFQIKCNDSLFNTDFYDSLPIIARRICDGKKELKHFAIGLSIHVDFSWMYFGAPTLHLLIRIILSMKRNPLAFLLLFFPSSTPQNVHHSNLIWKKFQVVDLRDGHLCVQIWPSFVKWSTTHWLGCTWPKKWPQNDCSNECVSWEFSPSTWLTISRITIDVSCKQLWKSQRFLQQPSNATNYKSKKLVLSLKNWHLFYCSDQPKIQAVFGKSICK